MTFNTQPLLRLLCSRSLAAVLFAASLVMTILGFRSYSDPQVAHGFGLPGPDTWLPDPIHSLAAAIGCQLLIVLGIMFINKAFNLLRGLRNSSLVWSGLFMLLQGADPAAGHFSGGYLLALIVLLCIGVFYGIYQLPDATRRIFVIFLVMGAGAMVADCFIPFIAVMILGCFQMRVFSLRCLVALSAGLFVPPWLLWAFGLWTPSFTPADLRIVPAADMMMSLIYPVVLVLVTLALGFVAGAFDIVRVYGRNAMTRARFGLISVTGIMAGIMAIVAFGDVETFTPLLNITTAYCLALLFSFSPRHSLGAGGVIITISIILFLTLYIWRLIALPL